jgi:Mitotic-spindle organizing gamma-tubulin ring associated
MSQLLNTQLDKETLATCVSMIESGANPEAVAVSYASSLHWTRIDQWDTGSDPRTQTREFYSCPLD